MSRYTISIFVSLLQYSFVLEHERRQDYFKQENIFSFFYYIFFHSRECKCSSLSYPCLRTPKTCQMALNQNFVHRIILEKFPKKKQSSKIQEVASIFHHRIFFTTVSGLSLNLETKSVLKARQKAFCVSVDFCIILRKNKLVRISA